MGLNEFQKLTPFEKKIVMTMFLLQEIIDYGMKNPDSDIGRLMRIG